MDKMNIFIISIICILVGINVYIILNVFWGFGSEPFADGELAHEYGCIAMNDDGQAVNGSSEDMWFRARIIDDESVSDGADNRGNEDDWVYIDETISPGAMSETFLPHLQDKESTERSGARTSEGGIILEGICKSWVDEDVNSAEEAFTVSQIKPLWHYKSSCI